VCAQIIATFVGTIAFTTATSALNSITSTGVGAIGPDEARLLVLAVMLYASFLNFALTLRSSNHLGYLLSSATGRFGSIADGGGGGGAANGAPPAAAPSPVPPPSFAKVAREASLRSLYAGHDGSGAALAALVPAGVEELPPLSPAARLPLAAAGPRDVELALPLVQQQPHPAPLAMPPPLQVLHPPPATAVAVTVAGSEVEQQALAHAPTVPPSPSAAAAAEAVLPPPTTTDEEAVDELLTQALITRAQSDASGRSGPSPPQSLGGGAWWLGSASTTSLPSAAAAAAAAQAAASAARVASLVAAPPAAQFEALLPAATAPPKLATGRQPTPAPLALPAAPPPPPPPGAPGPPAAPATTPSAATATSAAASPLQSALPSPHGSVTSGGTARRPRRVRDLIQRRVSVPLRPLEAAAIADRCERLLVLLQIHLSLGFRSLYLAVPVAIYAAGPVAFMVASAAIGLWLVYVDRAAMV
jgi:hypothetical protein